MRMRKEKQSFREGENTLESGRKHIVNKEGLPCKTVPALGPTYTDPWVGICRAKGLYMST